MENNACISQSTDWSETPSVAEASHDPTRLTDSERALLDRVALQDERAFAMLFTRYAPPVRRYLHRCLSHTDLVDDVLQEVMLVLWQRPSACPPTVSLTAWLCGIARHKAWKAMTRAATPPVLSRPPLDSDADDPAHVVLDQESARRLARAIDTLPFYERTALQLRVHQGCSYQDIAAVMDTPISTVRTRIARACHRLRAHVVAVDATSPRPRPCRTSAARARRCTHL
jgi:RNA polymerase sigma-70 factor (ECF subfamily)